MFERLVDEIKKKFENEGTGHDWFHIQRVMRQARFIHSKEGGDKEVISYAALLHDIDDHKFNGGDFESGARKTEILIKDHPLDESQKQNIVDIVRTISFKGSGEKDEMNSLEGKIVQDADRLDALGAIGIARTFAYGGSIGQPIYDPAIEPSKNQTKEQYISDRTHTINHFYEKLLLLPDLMNTMTGKSLAKNRVKFMENFLEQFYSEWGVSQ